MVRLWIGWKEAARARQEGQGEGDSPRTMSSESTLGTESVPAATADAASTNESITG